jgi:REP element-mobilizing transposase RayT
MLGEIKDGAMCLNDVGRIVEEEWRKTSEVRRNVQLDLFIVMPNHLHGILMLRADAPPPTGTPPACPYRRRSFGGSRTGSLSVIIGQFKSMVTRRVQRLTRKSDVLFWQRNYFEHVIRNDADLFRIRQYIIDNPAQWECDENHPNFPPGSKVRQRLPWEGIVPTVGGHANGVPLHPSTGLSAMP